MHSPGKTAIIEGHSRIGFLAWLIKVAMVYGTVILGLPLFVIGATFGQESEICWYPVRLVGC